LIGVTQEICNNALDDDMDGLINLNDDDCDCSGFGGSEISSLIPNPSFEEMSCCPGPPAMLSCAENWIQSSLATSDYFNLCGFTEFDIMGFIDAELPISGDGGG